MYSYKFVNGYCIVNINNEEWLINTGSEKTYRLNGSLDNIVIDDILFKVKEESLHKEDIIIKKIGYKIAGVIGNDILSQTNLTIYKDNKLDFKADPSIKANPINILIEEGIIAGMIKINNKEASFLFDTGEGFNYLNPDKYNVDKNSKSIFTIDSFNYEIEGKLSILDCELGNIKKNLSFLIPINDNNNIASGIKGLGDAIIGLYNFEFNEPIFDKAIVIDYKKVTIYIE